MDSELTVASPSRGLSSTPEAGQPNLAARHKESRRSMPTTPAFLSNLGKATLRGIRKCPQCGVYNGTRGLSCKNKACGVVLRDGSAGRRSSKKSSIEVVKIVIDGGEPGDGEAEEGAAVGGSGGGAQVFSVCQRGRGATAPQFGFVELVPTDTAIATGDGATLLTRINLGRCFLPSCKRGQRSNQSRAALSAVSSSKHGTSSDSLCAHIKQAMECPSHASPLTLKSSILEGLQVSAQAREELWRLATETPGPLVQRVSKDTVVVKCHTDAHHPLGLLHLTVVAEATPDVSKGEGKGREQAVFHCACQAGARRGKLCVDGTAQPGARASTTATSPSSSATPEPCLHFYACVCAFASDDKLATDFESFINYSQGVQQSTKIICAPDKALPTLETVHTHHKVKRPRLDGALGAPSVLLPAGAGRQTSAKRTGLRKAPGASGLKTQGSTHLVDERSVSMGFHQWLASVTEKIHQTMHYQFDGKPEPLVYQIPQDFFNALQNRFSLGSKKRRLPNTTTTLFRNNGILFSKYTWHIINLMQVKRIFDTPELPLELTQSFVKNIDGSYSPFNCPEPPPEPELMEGYRTERPQAIRPMELRTFLKVGTCTADQKEPTPFVMEWIPDVLPRSHLGELSICFEFGHQQSGQPEYCEGLTGKGAERESGSRTKSSADPSQTNHTQTIEVLQVVG